MPNYPFIAIRIVVFVPAKPLRELFGSFALCVVQGTDKDGSTATFALYDDMILLNVSCSSAIYALHHVLLFSSWVWNVGEV